MLDENNQKRYTVSVPDRNIRHGGGENAVYAVDQKAIRRVIYEENLKTSDIASHLEISRRAVCNKINDPEGRLWKARELAMLANLVHVDPGAFFVYS